MLIVGLLSMFIPWLRSRRMLKFALAFLVIWTLYGQLTVMIDPQGGNGPVQAFMGLKGFESAQQPLAKEPYRDGYVYKNPSWIGDPTDPVDANLGGWPFGKLYVWVLSCVVVAGREMAWSIGPMKAFRPRMDVHHIPKLGSWFNMAELELSVLQLQCLNLRRTHRATVEHEGVVWVTACNTVEPPSTGASQWRTPTSSASAFIRPFTRDGPLAATSQPTTRARSHAGRAPRARAGT